MKKAEKYALGGVAVAAIVLAIAWYKKWPPLVNLLKTTPGAGAPGAQAGKPGAVPPFPPGIFPGAGAGTPGAGAPPPTGAMGGPGSTNINVGQPAPTSQPDPYGTGGLPPWLYSQIMAQNAGQQLGIANLGGGVATPSVMGYNPYGLGSVGAYGYAGSYLPQMGMGGMGFATQYPYSMQTPSIFPYAPQSYPSAYPSIYPTMYPSSMPTMMGAPQMPMMGYGGAPQMVLFAEEADAYQAYGYPYGYPTSYGYPSSYGYPGYGYPPTGGYPGYPGYGYGYPSTGYGYPSMPYGYSQQYPYSMQTPETINNYYGYPPTSGYPSMPYGYPSYGYGGYGGMGGAPGMPGYSYGYPMAYLGEEGYDDGWEEGFFFD